MSQNSTFRIGSRDSALAVVQAEMLLQYLKTNVPDCPAELVTMKTTGDKILDRRLDEIGGKGLFVKELDLALREGRSDLSVHSLKDLPMVIPEELPLVGCSAREDPRDVLVLPEGKSSIDFSLPIGTSSPRRILQLKRLFPEASFASVRGNLQTRLRKLDEGQYSALVLAAAGMKRMDLSARISRYFSPEEIIPAAGQGILGLQGRSGENYDFLAGFCDEKALSEALAERAFVARLDGDCSSPIAAHAVYNKEESTIRILGFFSDTQGDRQVRDVYEGSASDLSECILAGQILADRIRERAECSSDPGDAEIFIGKTDRSLPEREGCLPENDSALPEKDVSIRKIGEHMTRGKVFLVGAGPGDPGLFTLKGKQVLEEADVVVYDALVGQGVLQMIPKNAEKINVGKRSSNHIMPQEEINRLLARLALEGKKVVRLKGGDPFLFGRGGEELELLTQQDIPYEIVPGITSAISVPAYNGIPVTHRDFCSSVHIITGHKRAGASYDIDFEALVRTRGTLVFLMGLASLPDIAEGLIRGGMRPDMPAAVLSRGTTARQRRVVAQLSELAEQTRRAQIEAPAIIVVGEVCSLADVFNWLEKKPLFGRKILVTRPAQLISAMADKLRSQGAEVLELPAIRTVPMDGTALTDALASIPEKGSFDWIVFTSPTGVRIFMEKLSEEGDLRLISSSRIAAIGSGTAKELKKYALKADFVPSVYDGDTLGRELAGKLAPGMRVLIPRAAIGNRELTDHLTKADGVEILDVPTYDTLYEQSELIDEAEEFRRGKIDFAVFTSASTVRGFARAVGDLDYSLVNAVCIGKQTRAAADELGMRTFVSEKATMDSVVEKVIELCTQDS